MLRIILALFASAILENLNFPVYVFEGVYVRLNLHNLHLIGTAKSYPRTNLVRNLTSYASVGTAEATSHCSPASNERLLGLALVGQ